MHKNIQNDHIQRIKVSNEYAVAVHYFYAICNLMFSLKQIERHVCGQLLETHIRTDTFTVW